MEEETKKFEKRMLIIMIVTSVLACIAIILVPIQDSMTRIGEIKGFLVIILIIALAFISNTISITAIVLSKKR